MDQFEEMKAEEKKEKEAMADFEKFCSKLKNKYVRNNSKLDFYYSNIHKWTDKCFKKPSEKNCNECKKILLQDFDIDVSKINAFKEKEKKKKSKKKGKTKKGKKILKKPKQNISELNIEIIVKKYPKEFSGSKKKTKKRRKKTKKKPKKSKKPKKTKISKKSKRHKKTKGRKKTRGK